MRMGLGWDLDSGLEGKVGGVRMGGYGGSEKGSRGSWKSNKGGKGTRRRHGQSRIDVVDTFLRCGSWRTGVGLVSKPCDR